MCGEQEARISTTSARCGSSPRVRGTAVLISRIIISTRFIPACAGNRPTAVQQHHMRAVHPRVCGEQQLKRGLRMASRGSSPRVRGTVRGAWIGRDGQRFIPACAGNSANKSSLIFSASVHPRVCGEQHITIKQRVRDHGSSPRVRGTASLIHASISNRRFIPACAGNRVAF